MTSMEFVIERWVPGFRAVRLFLTENHSVGSFSLNLLHCSLGWRILTFQILGLFWGKGVGISESSNRGLTLLPLSLVF